MQNYFYLHFALRKIEAQRSRCPADPAPQRQPSASSESLPPFSLATNCPPTPALPPITPHPWPLSHLNWCSRELRILEEKRSASFSRLREYSSSISAFLRKNSWRSCSSCSRDSDCCSRHLNCSTSCVRISTGRGKERGIRLVMWTAVGPTQLTQCQRPRSCNFSSSPPALRPPSPRPSLQSLAQRPWTCQLLPHGLT